MTACRVVGISFEELNTLIPSHHNLSVWYRL
ncbi:Uncharacterised protein [Vibrio cholerae]|nr:Uncharacterised protein [Vibrio cholerae]